MQKSPRSADDARAADETAKQNTQFREGFSIKVETLNKISAEQTVLTNFSMQTEIESASEKTELQNSQVGEGLSIEVGTSDKIPAEQTELENAAEQTESKNVPVGEEFTIPEKTGKQTQRQDFLQRNLEKKLLEALLFKKPVEMDEDFTEALLDTTCECEDCQGERFESFLRPHEISDNYCYHFNRIQKCSCMSSLKVKSNYFIGLEMYKDMLAIMQEIRTGNTLGSDLKGKFKNHFAVILILTTKDKNLVCNMDMDRTKFLNECYNLRTLYGDSSDHGQKSNSNYFEAQSFGDSLLHLLNIAKNQVKKGLKCVKSVIKSVFSKTVEFLQGLFGIISASLSKLMNIVFGYILKQLYQVFDPASYIKDSLNNPTYNAIIIVVTVIFLGVAIDLIGILTVKLSVRLIDTLANYFNNSEKSGYYAESQGPDASPLIGLVALFGMVLGLTTSDTKVLASKCRDFTALVSCGVSVSLVCGSLFLCLPVAVQTAMKMKFGSKVDREKIIVDDWLTRTTALIQLSSIPRVLVSDSYHTWVTEVLQMAQGLRRTITTPIVANLFIRNLVQLSKIMMMLEQYRLSKSHRDYPYSLHIAAPPGYSKTLLSSKLGRDVFDVTEKDIYTRPISSDYWDGFITQQIILYDEFLIGSKEVREMIGREYLEIVSNKTFQPPMASIDSPTVGIKGTVASPLGVITINNTAYDRVGGIPDEALQRRRHFVIKVRISLDYADRFAHGKMDMSSLTNEQIRNVDWLRFSLLPPTPGSGLAPIEDLTYSEMVSVLRGDYANHKRICENLREGLHGAYSTDKTPEQMLEDVLRELNGIPNEPISVLQSIINAFSDTKDAFVETFFPSEEQPGEATAQAPERSAQGMDEPSTSEWQFQRSTLTTEEKKLYRMLKRITARNSVEANISYLAKAQAYADDLEPSDNVTYLMLRLSERHNLIEENFETASEGESSVGQKDVLTMIDHSNVDPNALHRHVCPSCGRHYAHRHADRNPHKLACKDCDPLVDVLVYPLNPFRPKTQDLRSLIPEDVDYTYPFETDEVRNNLNIMWSKQVVGKYLSLGTIPVICFPTEKDEISAWGIAKGRMAATAKGAAAVITIYVVVRACRALFGGKKEDREEVVCFSQSPPVNKVSSGRNRVKSFKNGGIRAQGPDGLLTYEIDGLVKNAIPIKDRTFMTYLHGLTDDNGDLMANGKDVTVRYKGGMAKFKFNSSFIRFDESNDLAFVTMPLRNGLNAFPDGVKKFWTLNESENYISGTGLINSADSDKYVSILKVQNRYYTNGKSKVHLPECLQYGYPTVKGDCGLAITSSSRLAAGKIIGMHVAGGSKGLDHFGLALMITREDVEAALKEDEVSVSEDVSFESQSPIFYGPNLLEVSAIPKEDEVYLTRKSKLKPSVISSELPWEAKKFLPILSREDERAMGEDPVVNMINDTLNRDQPEVDENLVKEIFESMEEDFRKELIWPIGKRQLTFEEALEGIPGVLASMKVSSSAGFPLCKNPLRKRGKRDFFWFDEDGKLGFDKRFKILVLDRYRELSEANPSKDRFVAFMKDELISQKKVDQRRARLIYCANLVTSVAFRMMFGSLIIALNKSFETTSSSVGMNQYSYDMDMIHDYLAEVGENFVAGDFKNFDKTMVRQFQMGAYRMLMNLVDDAVPDLAKLNFIENQTESPIQVMGYLLRLVTSHFSGCFFTTPLNIVVHEGYIRYVFAKRCKGLVFKKHCRCKLLGDDHIYCFSDEAAPFMTPCGIRDELKKLSLTYTSDLKDEDLTEEFRSFNDITFLGAHPTLLNGKWCGALKKDSLMETLMWTRNNNATITDECRTAMELSSMWGREFYLWYCKSVNDALMTNNLLAIDMPCWSEMSRVVAERTASSNADFPCGFTAQGPTNHSLVILNEKSITASRSISSSTGLRKLQSRAVNECSMDLGFSTDSDVFRTSFDWKTTDVAGEPLLSIDCPFGVLAMGQPDNVQNMPFDRYLMWNGDVLLKFQLNGTQFQCGLLAVVFMPLGDYPPSLSDITTTTHVLLQPDCNSTAEIYIPFLYLRTCMNTIARETESLGRVYVIPLSPLNSVDTDKVTVTMFSSFPNSEFKIPRPLATTSVSKTFYAVDGSTNDYDTIHSFEGPFEAQGATQSSTVTNQYVNIAGSMPIEGITNSNSAELDQTTDVSPDISIPMPLDNPPLCSGGVPVYQQFPGMSSSHGVRPTTDMQLYPSAFSREQMDIFNPAETKIETLLSKRCLLTTLEVKNTNLAGTNLYKIRLNTRMGLMEASSGIPVNVAILNQFIFWRASIKLDFVAVRTFLHSMRLQTLLSYGTSDVVDGSRSVGFSDVMDFSGDNSTNSITIPYNAQTEFLRTYEGEAAVDPLQNYSLGTFAVYVLNALVAPESVPSTIKVLVFVSFVDAKVAVPRPYGPFFWNDYLKVESGTFTVLAQSDNGLTSGSSNVYTPKSKFIFGNEGTPPVGRYRLANPEAANTSFLLFRPSGDRNVQRSLTHINIEETNLAFDVTPFTKEELEDVDLKMSKAVWKGELVLFSDPTREIEFFSQGPDTNDKVSGTVEDFEATPSVEVTETETADRPNVVCKLEVGRKFEFCVSDVHEVGRRYVRVVPKENEKLEQFVRRTVVYKRGSENNYLNFPVQPSSIYRGLFAAWAGSIKYRIFRPSGSDLNVAFVPYYNANKSKPSIPLMDAMDGSVFRSFGPPESTLYSTTGLAGCVAREVMLPVSNLAYIDVSAPFQSHFNFCFNSDTQSIAPISSGTLVVSEPKESELEIYSAFGDDLRLGLYRPPKQVSFVLGPYKDGIAGFF